MTWHLAPCLVTLRSQVNKIIPNRHKDNDGTIGDTEHAARKSDHNPDRRGVVCALDLTHDPHFGGLNSYHFADLLRLKHDHRIAYIISNRRIWNPSISNLWRRYTGTNPHTEHVHISVSHTPPLCDDASMWDLTLGDQPSQPVPKVNEDFTGSGKAGWYSQYRGKYSWVDAGDEPNSNVLGVRDSEQGISFYNRAGLGKWFWVKAPNGRILKKQQTDIGPAPWTGRKIDIAAVTAEEFGYSPNTFPTGQIFYWRPA